MAQDKKHITAENITEWLASTGFLFPRNEKELARFEKIYGDLDYGLTGMEIDPEKIINNDFAIKKAHKIDDTVNQNEISEYKMAARKGKSLPKHIMEKIIKNQKQARNDSHQSESPNQ